MLRLEKARIVFLKEVVDNVRDIRSLSMALLSPLVGPLVAALIFALLGEVRESAQKRPLELAVSGKEHAPNLIAFLEENQTRILEAPADPELAVRLGKYDAVLIIPPEYPGQVRSGEAASVRLVIDDSRRSAQETIVRATRLLEAHGERIGLLRLIARGVDPEAGQAIVIEVLNVATPESRAALLLNMLPYFIIFAVFLGGLYVAIDTTTGERERGSLEPLVIAPISRPELLAGKLFATMLFATIALIETTLGFLALPHLISMEALGFALRLDPVALLRIFALVLPLVLLASALQMIIASFATGFKEAQTYLSILVMVPMFPGLVLAAVPVHPKLWMMFIPTFSEQILINQLLRGEPVPPLHVIVAAGTTLAAGLLLAFVAVALYRGERLIFGR